MAYCKVNHLRGITNKIDPQIMAILENFIFPREVSGDIFPLPNDFNVEDIAETWLKIVYKSYEYFELESSDGDWIDFRLYELDSTDKENAIDEIETEFKKYPKVVKILKEKFLDQYNEEELLKAICENLDIDINDYDIIYEQSDYPEYIFNLIK